MITMGCNEFLRALDGWMEGERPPDAAAHLGACPNCRTLVTDLETVRAASLELGREEAEPPARVWTGLRARLEEEGLIRQRGWRWFGNLVPALPGPAIAAAYLALLAVAGFLVGSQARYQSNQDRWLNGTQVASASLDRQLGTVEQQTVSALHEYNPEVTSSLNKNLAIVDNMIAACEKSVQEEPQNEEVRDYLYGAYQQKAELLATMSERGVMAQ
jgi:hypothetical protein